MVCVNSEEEGLKKIFEGEFKRSITKGTTYPASHLATSVITIHVCNTSLITSWGTVTTAKVCFVSSNYVNREIGGIVELRVVDWFRDALIRNLINLLDTYRGNSWYRNSREE